jgi:hypothetical protein
MNDVSVFLSSTSLDLKPERAAIEQVLRHMKRVRFVGMEYFGTRDDSARVASLAEVDDSDVYVGVLGHRYGSGITEAEYRRAKERGLPCLIYVKVSPDGTFGESENATQLAAFRDEVEARHLVVRFTSADELPARVAADLHNLILDQLLVQGIGKLHADYDARIRRFVAEYLGDAQHPIAFGGRDRDLKRLDRWLDDDSLPPYALLAGSAGRGKSALLVRWVQRVIARDDLDLIFFPISIRFRTNRAEVAFASIAARLATLHGEALPGAADTPAETWRGLVASYLTRPLPHGRRLLLVIDGADETADASIGPDLFPLRPPAGLKILVSARLLAGDVDATGWLDRIGWNAAGRAYPLELEPLTPNGLVQVLRNMSVPLEVLSGRSDIVAELFRLSAGDPLLVNLYAADLWTRGEEVARLQPSDLAQIEPGLEGYFARWWRDQRELWGAQSPQLEPAYNDVLNVLACALGPLLISELLELLPPERPLDVWAVQDVVQSLKRFVIGDGDVQGYAFGHPRLGDYFYEQLQAAGRAEMHEARFVSWGLRCTRELETRQDDYQVPVYVLQFLRRHMDRARCDAAAFEVLSSTLWARAWERLDRGSYTGFLSDLSVVRHIVSGESGKLAAAGTLSPFTATELRCSLCSSSIVTLASDLSVPVLMSIVSKGIWSAAQAIAYASNIPQRRARLATLIELATVVDNSYVPLALAAAVGETRSLCASDQGRDVVRDLVSELGAGIDALKSAVQLARKAGVLKSVAKQLPAPDHDWLSHLLEMPNVVRTQGAVAEWELQVNAALEALGAVAITSQAHRDRALEHAVRLLPHLEPSRWPDTMERIAPLISASIVEVVCAATERLPLGTRVRSLVTLFGRAPAESAAHIRESLAQAFDRHQASAAEHLEALRTAARWLPSGDLLAEVDRAGSTLTGAQRVALYNDIASACADSDVVAELAHRALAALETPLERDDAIPALAALVDWLLPPGLGDSLEPWRYYADTSRLYRQLRRLLSVSTVSRNRGRIVAFTLAQSFGSALIDERGALPDSVRRAVHELHGMEANEETPPADPTTGSARRDTVDRSELATRVLASYGGGKELAEVLADTVRALQPAPTFVELLRLFAELCRWVPPPRAREALGLVLEQANLPDVALDLEHVLPLLAAGPLTPPSAQTLTVAYSLAELASRDNPDKAIELFRGVALPDDVRLELLSGTLSNLQDEEQRALRVAVIGDIGRLSVTPARLLRSILSRSQERTAGDSRESLKDAICRLSAGDWLSVVRLLDVHVRRDWVTRLPDYWPQPAHSVWTDLVGAIHALRSDRDKTMWLLDVAACGIPADPAALLAAARSIGDDDRRLVALAAVTPRLPIAARPAVVVEALKLCRRRGKDPLVARGLIQCAVDLGAESDLATEAIEAALTLTDRALRSNAVAELAPSLSAESLGNALSAFRRIDDVVHRARAMKALIASVTDPPCRQRAEAHVRSSMEGLPAAERRAAALFFGPLLTPPARWHVLEEALSQTADEATAFTLDELARSLAAALEDAPAKLFTHALDWLRRIPAGPVRAEALARLMPFMPEGLLPRAFVRLAESASFLYSNAGRASLDRAFWFFPARTVSLLGRQRGPLSTDANRLLKDLQARQAGAGRAALPPPSLRDLEEQRVAYGPSYPEYVFSLRAVLAHRHSTKVVPELLYSIAGIRDDDLRRDTVPYLGMYRSPQQLAQAIALTKQIQSPADRCAVRLRLSSGLAGTERERLLEDALSSAGEESHGFARAFAAAEVAAAEPARLLPALDVLYAGNDVNAKAAALAELVPRLPDASAAAAIGTLHRLGDWWVEARVLSRIAQRLGPQAATAGLARAMTVPSGVVRARVAAALVPRLEDAQRSNAETLLDGTEPDYAWLELLGAIAERWPTALTTRARTAAACIEALSDDDLVSDWLVRMTPHWPAAEWDGFLEAVNRIGVPSARSRVLNELLRHLEPAAIPDAVGAAMHALTDPYCRSVAFGHLAVRVGDEELLAEAMQSATRSGDSSARTQALVAIAELAQRLPDLLLSTLLGSWSTDTRGTAGGLISIGSLMSATQAHRVLELLHEPPPALPADLLVRLLATVTQRLAPAHLREVIEVAARHCSERHLVDLLVDLGARPDSSATASAALDAALAMKSPTYRADVIGSLFERLSGGDRERAVAALPGIEDSGGHEQPYDFRGNVESTSTPATSDDDIEVLLQSLMDDALVRDPVASPRPARRFRMTGESPPQTLTLAKQLSGLECETDRFFAIQHQIESLSPSDLDALLEELPQHVTDAHEAELLGAIATRVPAPRLSQVLASAVSITDPVARRRAVQLVVPHLAPVLRPALHLQWRDFLEHASRANRDDLFADLEAVLPFLVALGGDEGIADAIGAIDEIGRSWP